MNFNWPVYLRMLAVHNIRYVVFAGIAFLLFYVLWKNKKRNNKIQQRTALKKDFLREISHSLLNGFLFALIGYLLMATPLRASTKFYSSIDAYGFTWIFGSVFVMLVLHDTYFYWMHRIIHHKAIFKFVHLVHHKSNNPSPFAAYSFHFLEAVLESGVIFLLPFFIPVHQISFVMFSTIALAINVYGHLGYEVMPKWFRNSLFFEFINTSVYHNMHHSKFKGNYGLYFRMWDRLLGTEHPDYVRDYDKIQQQRFGERIQPEHESKTILKKSIAAVLMVTLSISAFAQIEGKWKTEDKTAVIEIYKQGDKYFGKLVWTIPEQQKKIPEGKTVMVLMDFEKKNAVTFINGTINMVRKKRKVNGTLTLKDDNRLELYGSYMGYKGKQVWTRI
jgi:Delta7-sterol 5-desaturase